MAKVSDWENKMNFMNSDADMTNCESIGANDRACYFILSHNNPKLGISFNAEAEVDLYYETAWTSVIPEVTI
jgi:hypothetical protein